MSEKVTKRRKAKDDKSVDVLSDKPTKLQKKVTHWLRRNVQSKKTKFMHSHEVSFFTGAKAVTGLLDESPWSKNKVKDPLKAELCFESREQCVAYLDQLLKLSMFHRAVKIPVAETIKKKKKVDDKTDTEKSGSKSDKEKEKSGTKPGKEKEKKDSETEAASKKKKRKIRLEMHAQQIFMDSSDAYVWVYDPVPWYYWVVGTIIVLGVIGVCLFPLWPQSLRLGVHYLSLAAAGFLVCLIGLAVMKYVVFALLFLLTAGKLKLWIFPNLTEDVGFMESFLPMYECTWTGSFGKKASDSDEEEESESENEEEKNKDGEKMHPKDVESTEAETEQD